MDAQQKVNRHLSLEQYGPASAIAETMANSSMLGVLDSIYGLSDPHEMLAESLSNPNFMLFMSQFQTEETINSGPNEGKKKSLLYRWYQDLFKWVKDKLAHLDLLPKNNNVLDYFMDMIASSDEEFIMGDLPRKPAYGMHFGINSGATAKREK